MQTNSWPIRKVAPRDAKAKWSSIEAVYVVRSSEAESMLSVLKGSGDAKAKVVASKAKHNGL